MKIVKKTDEYTVYLRRDGRHAVTGADKAPINGDEKVRILAEAGLVSAPAVAAAEPAAADVEEAGDAGADTGEGEAEGEAAGDPAAADDDATE